MKITALEPQKHNRERLNLYIDGVFHSGIEIGTAAKLGFYEGKEVTETNLSQLDTEDDYQKCMNAALNLASRRLQSEREYWQKLGKKYEKPIIGRCLDRLRQLGYANDQKFAEMWVRERSRTRGKRLLETELKEKGIAKDIIQQVLEQTAPVINFEEIIQAASKKFKSEDSYEKNYSRIAGFLGRKGYDYGIIKQVAAEILKKTAE